MENTIKVSIARLGTSINEVEIPTGSTVMNALRKAGYDLDWVVSIKRNWSVVTLDTTLANEDVLLVSMDKIKGGSDEATATEPQPLRVSFTIEKENQVQPNNMIMFLDNMSTFEIVKEVMHSRGVSLNNFKEIKDSEGNVVTFADKLCDGCSYKIIIVDEPTTNDDDESNEDD